MLNAGTSPTGQAFAIRNCDAFFTAVRQSDIDADALVTPNLTGIAEVVRNLAGAAELGREIGVYTNVNLICRPTRREAIDYYEHALINSAEWAAIHEQTLLMGKLDVNSAEYRLAQQSFIRKIPAIGDPDMVANLLIGLSELGFDGVGITMVNYLDELPLLCDEVLPRLEKAGLRSPV